MATTPSAEAAATPPGQEGSFRSTLAYARVSACDADISFRNPRSEIPNSKSNEMSISKLNNERFEIAGIVENAINHPVLKNRAIFYRSLGYANGRATLPSL